MSCSIPESVTVKKSFVTGTIICQHHLKKRCRSFAQILTIHFRPHVEVYFSYVHCDSDRTPTAQNKTSAWDDSGTPIVTRTGKQLYHSALRNGCQKPRNTGQQFFSELRLCKIRDIQELFHLECETRS